MKNVIIAAATVLLLGASAASARVPAYGFGPSVSGQTATGGPSGGPNQNGG